MRKVRSAGELRLLSDVFEVSGATAAAKLNLIGGNALFSCDTYNPRHQTHLFFLEAPEAACMRRVQRVLVQCR